MTEENKFFFHNGIPYTEPIKSKDGFTYGKNIWNKNDIVKVKTDDIVFYEKTNIEEEYIKNCREAIIQHLIGWSNEKSIDLENKGREYIINQIQEHIKYCPLDLYNSCKKGKYGFLIRLSSIKLPDNLLMDRRLCSDNKIRQNYDEYIKYLLGKNWDIIKMFKEKYPFLTFMYSKYKENVLLQDIICLVPFYDEMDKINNSILL